MTESVSFKAYLKRDGQDVEVRRFGVDGGAATNFIYLRNKIHSMFPSIQNDQFSVFWQDNDKDYVAIGSDEELIEALTSGVPYPFKLFVSITSQEQQQSGQGVAGQPQAHPGVVCDSCDQAVEGFRYKCVTCPDFDLCAACEGARKHPEHFMLRMPGPLGSSFCHPKVFRKFFGRPHKFHKFARHVPQAAAFAGASARGCPFSRREGPTPAPAPGTGDMFDFSALLEFINSMTGCSTQEPATSEPTANAQTSTSSQSAPGQRANTQQSAPGQGASTQQSAPGQRANTQERPRSSDDDYLNGIGRAITSFLDPFGVNVTFDVRPPSSRTGETSAPQQSSSTTKPPAPSAANAPTSAQQNAPTPTQQNASTSTQQNAPISVQQNIPTSTQQNAPSNASAPTTSQQNALFKAPVSTSFQPMVPSPVAGSGELYPAIPLPAEDKLTTPRAATPPTARRNSDDWTLINRESPTRSELAMDVDEARAGRSNAEAPSQAPSAPQPEASLTDAERQRIQEAVNSIRSMGFNYETTLLRELLRRENGDISSVLETILNSGGK